MRRATITTVWGTKRDWRWLWLRKRPRKYVIAHNVYIQEWPPA